MSDTTFEFTARCPQCKTLNTMVVDRKAFEMWQSGVFIQDAFPNLTTDEREIMQTGTCGQCWEKMFASVENV